MSRSTHSTPPKHLSPDARGWWKRVVAEYELDEHHRRMLTAACEAWDTMDLARRQIAAEGITVLDRFGTPKPHPAVGIAKDARIQFLRALRELDLDGTPSPDPRIPRLR